MGLALGGLLPCVASVSATTSPTALSAPCWAIPSRPNTRDRVVGPLLGGFVGGHFGMRAVFLGTAF